MDRLVGSSSGFAWADMTPVLLWIGKALGLAGSFRPYRLSSSRGQNWTSLHVDGSDQRGQAQGTVTYQASAGTVFVPLTKVSHMAKPKVKVGGDSINIWIPEMWFCWGPFVWKPTTGRFWLDMTEKFFFFFFLTSLLEYNCFTVLY